MFMHKTYLYESPLYTVNCAKNYTDARAHSKHIMICQCPLEAISYNIYSNIAYDGWCVCILWVARNSQMSDWWWPLPQPINCFYSVYSYFWPNSHDAHRTLEARCMRIASISYEHELCVCVYMWCPSCGIRMTLDSHTQHVYTHTFTDIFIW